MSPFEISKLPCDLYSSNFCVFCILLKFNQIFIKWKLRPYNFEVHWTEERYVSALEHYRYILGADIEKGCDELICKFGEQCVTRTFWCSSLPCPSMNYCSKSRKGKRKFFLSFIYSITRLQIITIVSLQNLWEDLKVASQYSVPQDTSATCVFVTANGMRVNNIKFLLYFFFSKRIIRTKSSLCN